ncbi:hypothetical protein [Paenarthrobacter sp. FR1]|uniref:hypothetical protein n=1 Tax=Paenarthrobacter sp. FR1 TaxID=3439548 RepID=UPI003DA516DB
MGTSPQPTDAPVTAVQSDHRRHVRPFPLSTTDWSQAMFYNPLTITEPAETPSFAYPSLSEDLNVIWDGLDGHIIGPIHATGADVQILDPTRNEFRQLAVISDVRIDCYVSQARIAMVCREYDKGGGWVGGAGALLLNSGSKIIAANRRRGKALAGHLRFPWLSKVLYHRKEGFFDSEILRLIYQSEGATMYLELTLDRSANSGALAQEIVQRTVAYRRADSLAFTAAEALAFDALQATGPVPPVEKGSMAKYTLPTSLPAGSGAQYAPMGPPSAAITFFNPPASQ